MGFTLNGSFSDKIMSIGLISLIGKLLLITSFFIKTENYKRVPEITGVIVLWISVYFLTNGDWIYDSAHEIAFYTSIPFLISSGVFALSIVLKVIIDKTTLNNKS